MAVDHPARLAEVIRQAIARMETEDPGYWIGNARTGVRQSNIIESLRNDDVLGVVEDSAVGRGRVRVLFPGQAKPRLLKPRGAVIVESADQDTQPLPGMGNAAKSRDRPLEGIEWPPPDTEPLITYEIDDCGRVRLHEGRCLVVHKAGHDEFLAVGLLRCVYDDAEADVETFQQDEDADWTDHLGGEAKEATGT